MKTQPSNGRISTTKTSLTEKQTASRPRNILEAFEQIAELAEDSNLSKEFIEKARPAIAYASKKLGLTTLQTVLLALFTDRSEDNRILISELASYTGCRTIRFLRFMNEIDVLEAKRYVRASRARTSLSYRVPHEVISSLRENSPYVHTEEPLTGLQSFFDRMDELMSEKNNDELTYDMLVSQTESYLEEISDTVFAKELEKHPLGRDETMLFVYMALLYVRDGDDRIGLHDIDNLYDEDRIPTGIKSGLRDRCMMIFTEGLVENVNDDGMARPDTFKLTDMAKETLLCELDTKKTKSRETDLIGHETFATKKLFYNADEESQVKELKAILTERRFSEIQRRLRESGMREGFCCLFYGSPGTGKTETVYQIARATGRDIMRVDVDRIKSCWVGESEKNIKSLFEKYRKHCRQSAKAPILLFNEADAILGVRMEGASKAVDKMENSIQNIILQEMESLEGIMIATTNLTSNLDSAFERRFLYKIRFNRPTKEAQNKIWRAMIPGLKPKDARKLAAEFDLAGGEIENIARKHSVSAILTGRDTADPDALRESCRHERISTGDNRKRIGY